jgi:ABC-2 type transport system permease protein
MALLFPAVIIVFSLMSQAVAYRSPDHGAGGAQGPSLGYVDEAGLIRTMPANVDPNFVRPFPDERTAEQALASGDIARYYVIPPGVVESGDLVRVEPDFRPLSGFDTDPLIRYIIAANLLNDQDKALVYQDPTPNPKMVALSPAEPAPTGRPAPTGGPQGPQNTLVSFAVVFILFFIITTTGGFMLQSVSREKENRTAEILLLSVSPRQIMFGKLLGLTAVALVQMGFWAGAVSLALDQARGVFNMAMPAGLPVASYAVGILFFLMGYLLYSSALGALGALAPTSREAGQFTMVILLPLLVPMFLNQVIMAAPNSAAAVGMSIFPLTAPVAMAARLVIVTVPAWQILVGLVGLTAATYFLVALSARFFRADTLLSSSSLSLARVREGLRRTRLTRTPAP